MNASQSFVEALCTQADTAMKAGDFSMVNRLASQPALKHYFDNVFKLKAITYENWCRDYPAYSASVDSLRIAYDAELAEKAKMEKLTADVASLAEKFDKLTAAVNAVTEAMNKVKSKAKTKEEPVKPVEESEPVEEPEEEVTEE